MARFMGIVQGQRGEASRLGSIGSGIRAQAQGWAVGVQIRGRVTDDGRDSFDIYATGGSSPVTSPEFLGTVTVNSDGKPEFFANN